MKKILLPLFSFALFTGCNPGDDDSYTIPESYNFENVSYTGQIQRLDMLAELTAYVKTSHTSTGTELDAQKMKDMFAGENSPFSDANLNASTKDLKSKTFVSEVDVYLSMFDSIALHCQITGAKNGKAGIIETSNRIILVDAKGQEYAQRIDKGLMGSCFYYQGTSVYLSDEKIGDAVDNNIIEEGKGTAKEHHFDEAFGYFGVPTDFPTNTDGIRFWGKYCNSRDNLVNTNDIMHEFIKGRAAISNKDQDAQDKAVSNIKLQWEKSAAATGIHYLNDGIAEFGDDANRCHVLTEAFAFIDALKYNADATITASTIDDVLATLGDNFWTVTKSDIEAARDLLATAAGLESVKGDL